MFKKSGNLDLKVIAENCIKGDISAEWLNEELTELEKNTLATMYKDSEPVFYSICRSTRLSVGLVNFFLDNGADGSYKNQDGCTAFHEACKNSQVSKGLLECFIDNKKHINDKDKYGNSPLHYLCGNIEVNAECLEVFSKHQKSLFNEPNARNHTPLYYLLHYIFTRGYKKAVQIIKALPEDYIDYTLKDDDENTLLHHACKTATSCAPEQYDYPIEALEILLTKNCSINAQDKYKKTALHYICRAFIYEQQQKNRYLYRSDNWISICISNLSKLQNIISMLIIYGADYNIKDTQDPNCMRTPFEYLFRYYSLFINSNGESNYKPAVKFLYSIPLYKTIIIDDDRIRQGLKQAIEKKHKKTPYESTRLVKEDRFFFLCLTVQKETLPFLLSYKVWSKKPQNTKLKLPKPIIKKILNWLLYSPLAITFSCSSKPQLFFTNVKYSNLHKIKLEELNKNELDDLINMQDNEKKNIFHYICKNGPLENIEFLLNYYININHQDKKTASNSPDIKGKTPLFYLCENKQAGKNFHLLLLKNLCMSRQIYPETIDMLIENKFDINEQDVDGNSLLHYVCEFDADNLEVIEYLINKKAIFDMEDDFQQSPLKILQESDLDQKNKNELMKFFEPNVASWFRTTEKMCSGLKDDNRSFTYIDINSHKESFVGNNAHSWFACRPTEKLTAEHNIQNINLTI